MDIQSELDGQRFVWNEDKELVNQTKHHVSFDTAMEVFQDPFLRYEDASSRQELRLAAIGFSFDWKMLYIIHIEQEDDVIRIISARSATTQEARRHEDSE